ncbi:hypothetical protein EJ08DRAFT_668173 [Tothia fuscella]|uniref:Pex N-terminal domain-containing protein n=1 Tax=Tothia fuscella TaxID=1048955 RepID=A0A9P4NZU3_9PEZI|nr:hypothetical protein EJ08DRAFT_668173 [Tothia fuscella]
MPSADFAAAQARLLARRQARESAEQSRLSALRQSREAHTTRLPFPFRNIGDAGLSVWDTLKGREGTRPAFRVGQVDAELLDEELLELMKAQVGEALKFYGTHLHTDYGSEILLALRAILFKLSIWDHNASYGASLQGLRYTDARDKSLSRPPPKRWQKSVYGLVTVAGRYAWTKWESYLADQDLGYEEPSPLIKRLSNVSSTLSSIHGVTALASFLTFLYNGQYRTLLDRALKLRLVPNSSHTSREVSFEYLNRQLVWHAFTEFLLFLLPLVGISRWRRILGRAYHKAILFFKRSFGRGGDDDEDASPKGELGFLPERTCAICYSDQNPAAGAGSEAEIMAASAGGGVVGSVQTDITNPYEAMPCGDVYCFVCIAERIESQEGEGWTCLRCGELVKECRPWNGDVIEEQPRPGTGGSKSVGFSHEASHEKDGIAKEEEHEEELKEVEPMPTEDEDEGHTESGISGVDGHESLIVDSGFGDSAEWARASEVVDGNTEPETETETETGASDYPSDEHSDFSDADEDDTEETDHHETTWERQGGSHFVKR